MKITFSDDLEKMIDFKLLTKTEFLVSYPYLTEEEYDATDYELRGVSLNRHIMRLLDRFQLRDLQDEIVMNSIYYSDYENSFGIDKTFCCDFFMGYIDYILYTYKEEYANDYDMSVEEVDDDDVIAEYDTAWTLEEWRDEYLNV